MMLFFLIPKFICIPSQALWEIKGPSLVPSAHALPQQASKLPTTSTKVLPSILKSNNKLPTRLTPSSSSSAKLVQPTAPTAKMPAAAAKNPVYKFGMIFHENSTTEDVNENLIADEIVNGLLNGEDTTIIPMGQPGSGRFFELVSRIFKKLVC